MTVGVKKMIKGHNSSWIAKMIRGSVVVGKQLSEHGGFWKAKVFREHNGCQKAKMLIGHDS